MDFWKDLMESSTNVKFPYDKLNIQASGSDRSKEFVHFPEATVLNLKKISQVENSSLSTILLSMLAVLIYKYTNENDICLGIVDPICPDDSEKKVNCLNFIRINNDKNFNFSELVRYINDTAFKKKISFHKLIGLNGNRDLADNKLSYQIIYAGSEENNSTLLDSLSEICGSIIFYMQQNGDSIDAIIEYNADLFERKSILRLWDNYLTLISRILANVHVPINTVSVISDKERSILDEYNQTQTPYPRERTIKELFEEQVDLYPDKAALVYKERSLTYRELNERSNHLAYVLREAGIKANIPVGLLADKSIEAIVGILGILKAGGCYVPIDPGYPEQRKTFIIEDSGCKTLLIQKKHDTEKFKGVTVYPLDLDLYQQQNENLKTINTSYDLANIIYTSGTTGKPKGTLIPQMGIVRLVRNTNYMTFDSEDRILQGNAIVFDVSTEEIFGALLNGACLFVVDKETILDPIVLGKFLLENKITFADLTSALFTQIAESGTNIFSGLKTLIIGGDVVSAPNVNKVRKTNPGLKIINSYGPTENSCNSTAFIIDREFDYNIPIGKPISNSTAYIFDKNMHYQPIGVVGELYVGGDGLSLGYLNRDDLNRTCFVKHPSTGERLYKTGDLARWLPDGNIEFHGRMDNQIKIRGFRVELGEIEAVLSEIEGIISAVVKPIKVDAADTRLVAFLDVPAGINIDPDALNGMVREKLPSYMIPSAYKTVNGFPLTVNGKIDRKALVFDIEEFAKAERNESKELTNAEKALIGIWSDFLKTKNILSTDNFFDIGGNSLLVLRCVNKIREECHVELTFKDFLSNPTITLLARIVDSQNKNSSVNIDLVHLTQTKDHPLTSNQKRLWLIAKMDPGVASYIIPFSFKFSGPLNRELFEKSLGILFNRHHIVFAVFKEVDGEPYYDIVPQQVQVSFTNLEHLAQEQIENKVDQIIENDSSIAFDLEKGPLYRLYLIKTAPDEHVFHFSIHHVVFDGWSWNVFANELSIIYNGLLQGHTPELQPLEYQQYDYAHWEVSPEGQENEKRAAAFWQENLKGCSSVVNFPFDYQRKGNSTNKGGHLNLVVSQSLTERLKKISKDQGASLYSTLLSVFSILIHKYSGEDDLNIGLPLAYRPHSRLENIFGMFVNTVVARLISNDNHTFKNSIQKTNNVVLNAISYQDLSFDKVVELMNPQRFSNVSPLFQIAFNWLNDLDEPLRLSDIKIDKIIKNGGIADFDIALDLFENRGTIEGTIEYNTDIIKPDSILRLRDNFLLLIERLLISPESSLESIALIPDREINIINSFNLTQTPYPREKTIKELFEEQADLYPDKTALVYKERSLTYRELNERSNHLAYVLREARIKANVPVGLIADKSIEIIVGILGILKAGGCYVPIDPEYPEQRTSFILSDAECKLVLTQQQYYDKPMLGLPKIVIEDMAYYQGPATNLSTLSGPNDLAYILYTSGTTGAPKGSLIPQCGVVRLVRNTNYIEFRSDDRVLQTAAFVFDASTEEIFGALLNGASLYLVNKETLLDPSALSDVLLTNEISVVDLSSALFTQLSEIRIDIFDKTRALILGGDVVSPMHVNKLRRHNPFIKVINTYGPTENSCNSTAFIIDRDFDYNIPIGKPISNSTAYIFDKNMNYQPIGVVGELFVGGDGLSLGYLNRDDLNSTCFVKHPLTGERLYKTGDLARWLPDGNIEFHGRMDNQIKIRGFRVELGEIEAVLSEIEGIISAVVKSTKVDAADTRLVAFLDVPSGISIDADVLNGKLREKLPSYMIPAAYKAVNGFPLTVNGKIDRKALVFESGTLDTVIRNESKELTHSERILIKIWESVLKRNDIISTDNFFDVGGNSLLVLSCINKIKEETGTGFSFKEFISCPTLSQLAFLLDNKQKNTESNIELTHLNRIRNLPLTGNQKRLWLISKLDPEMPTYIIPITYKFTGQLHQEIFEKSIQILFDRHFIVFSVLKESNGEPYFDIETTQAKITYTDISKLTDEEKTRRIGQVIEADSRLPFDLGKGPLYRLYLIKLSEKEHYFHLSIHHIIFDGWSWSIFAKDFSLIYNNLLEGKTPSLSPLKYQQYDYAEWEKNNAGLLNDLRSIEFWKENLRDCSPILNFPYDFPRKSLSAKKGNIETFKFQKSLSDALRILSKEEDLSLFTILLGALGIQMQKFSGQNDLNIGLPIAHRPHSGLEDVFGMFVNTVVVRLRYEKGDTFRTSIRKANETALNAISHQEVPFDKVVELTRTDRISNANPLFQVAFLWQNNLENSFNLNGISAIQEKKGEFPPNFDLSFNLAENGDLIEGEIEYNQDLLKPKSIVHLKNCFVQLLNSAIANPDQLLDELNILPEDDKRLIADFNNTESPYENNICIHQKFEQQVNKTPDETALIDDVLSLTYKELNEHANRMAHYLIYKGVNIEDKVVICLDRSIEMMICILGVLKAGAAYLPLNPDNPVDRQKSIIDDAKPKVILSTRNASKNIPEGVPVVFIDNILTEPLSDISRSPEININSRNLAYVLYTSGSTGQPKGVMIEHHSVLNRLGWMQKAYPIDKKDTLIQKTPITFDVSVWELFWWFFKGSKLVLPPKGAEKDPEEIINCINKYKVTTIHFVPSMFSTFFETVTFRKWMNKLESLNRIFLSGEALPLNLVKEFNVLREYYTLPDLINLYGPTEATVDVSYYNCSDKDIENVFIGKPIDNTKLFVVNNNNVIQPAGVPGELLITGVNLARGYLNRPELTIEKFFDFKLSENKIIRAYHSGDIVRLTSFGELEYLGRLDNQVKIRGFRIELGDIESKIMEHDAVINCAVIVEENRNNKYINAYVTLKQGYHITSEILRLYLSGKLPDYMVPSFIVLMENLPLTSSGKIDRKSLPKAGIPEKQVIANPANNIEKKLLGIWQRLLNIDKISTGDNFFDIGGNSLLAINLANQISNEFNIPLKPLFIFEFTNIKSQGENLSGKKDNELALISSKIEEKSQLKKNVNFKRLRE